MLMMVCDVYVCVSILVSACKSLNLCPIVMPCSGKEIIFHLHCRFSIRIKTLTKLM